MISASVVFFCAQWPFIFSFHFIVAVRYFSLAPALPSSLALCIFFSSKSGVFAHLSLLLSSLDHIPFSHNETLYLAFSFYLYLPSSSPPFHLNAIVHALYLIHSNQNIYRCTLKLVAITNKATLHSSRSYFFH